MPRNKYPEETRSKIIEAALRVFLEKGYEQTTVLDIVAHMQGLTRGAFYHHFKSKEEVLVAVSDKLFYDDNPFDAVLHEKGLNGLQKLRKALTMSLEDINDDYRLVRMDFAALMKSPAFLMDHLKFNTTLSRQYVQPLIEEGVADGSIMVQDPQLVAELLIMLSNLWLLPMLFSGDLAYMKRKADMIDEILTHLGLPLFDDDMEAAGHDALQTIAQIPT